MKIEFDTIEELKELLSYLGSLATGECETEKQNTLNAKRCKKYRDKKKSAPDGMSSMSDDMESMSDDMPNMSNSMSRHTENAEEEKESFSPSSPSVLPSSPSNSPINYPITPIIPSSQGKEEEKNIYAPEKSEKPKKHKYGNFQHVFLTDDDYQRLAADFADLPERIQRLDDYLENNPSKHYANHNLTIRNWAKKDSSQTPKEIPKEKTFRDIRIEMENQEREQDASQDYFVDSFWRA